MIYFIYEKFDGATLVNFSNKLKWGCFENFYPVKLCP